mgnify:CR=1 FL=1
MRQFLRQVHAINLVKKSLLARLGTREEASKTHQNLCVSSWKNPPLIIGQEVSVLVLTHANFTHLGISSQ